MEPNEWQVLATTQVNQNPVVQLLRKELPIDNPTLLALLDSALRSCFIDGAAAGLVAARECLN